MIRIFTSEFFCDVHGWILAEFTRVSASQVQETVEQLSNQYPGVHFEAGLALVPELTLV